MIPTKQYIEVELETIIYRQRELDYDISYTEKLKVDKE